MRPLTCCKCSVMFGMTEVLYLLRLEDHGVFYCPNGHSQSFTGKTKAEKLAEELEYMRGSRDRAVDDAQSAKYQARALKGANTKLRKRLGEQ